MVDQTLEMACTTLSRRVRARLQGVVRAPDYDRYASIVHQRLGVYRSWSDTRRCLGFQIAMKWNSGFWFEEFRCIAWLTENGIRYLLGFTSLQGLRLVER
jgi:hypothetical protein